MASLHEEVLAQIVQIAPVSSFHKQHFMTLLKRQM